jgi:zinc protease
MTIYGPNVPLPAAVMTWQRPRLNHPDSAAFAVLNQVLSGGQSSRLYRSLVYERQLAQSASSIDFGAEDAGMFGLQAIVASGKDISEAETALGAEIARLREAPVTAAELAEAKTEIVADMLRSRETPEGRANELGRSLTSAGDPRWGDRLLAAVQRVTAADVQRVARQYLRDDRRLTMRYLDQAQRTGEAAVDPSARPTDVALGRSFPPATRAPLQPAPEAERQAPPAPGASRAMAPPAFAERRLSNGMRVVAARSTDLPLASAYLVFGGGTAADPAARPGVASMMATLADNGAAGMSAPEIAARGESLGAIIGAGATLDSTNAFVVAPSANIEAAGTLLRQIVRQPAFAQEELERERRRAIDRLRVSMRDPGFVAQRVAARAAYGAAPYGAPAIGTPASLAALTRDEIAAYHASWWRPDNATLVITGGMSADEAFALAERLFGDWAAPAAPMPALPANRAGETPAPRIVVVDHPEARRLVHRAPVPGGPGAARLELRREQRPSRLSRRGHAGRFRPDPQRCGARSRSGDAGGDPAPRRRAADRRRARQAPDASARRVRATGGNDARARRLPRQPRRARSADERVHPLHGQSRGGDAPADRRLDRVRARSAPGEHRHRRPRERVPDCAEGAASQRRGDSAFRARSRHCGAEGAPLGGAPTSPPTPAVTPDLIRGPPFLQAAVQKKVDAGSSLS